ncbi:hypothetical protein S83_024488 [Arachis hypogaea]
MNSLTAYALTGPKHACDKKILHTCFGFLRKLLLSRRSFLNVSQEELISLKEPNAVLYLLFEGTRNKALDINNQKISNLLRGWVIKLTHTFASKTSGSLDGATVIFNIGFVRSAEKPANASDYQIFV